MDVRCEVVACNVCFDGVHEEADPGTEDPVALLLSQAAAVIIAASVMAIVVSAVIRKWVCQEIAGEDGEETD